MLHYCNFFRYNGKSSNKEIFGFGASHAWSLIFFDMIFRICHKMCIKISAWLKRFYQPLPMSGQHFILTKDSFMYGKCVYLTVLSNNDMIRRRLCRNFKFNLVCCNVVDCMPPSPSKAFNTFNVGVLLTSIITVGERKIPFYLWSLLDLCMTSYIATYKLI